MGMIFNLKQRISVFAICMLFVFVFTACSNFNTAKINLSNIKLEKVIATSSSAYYLSEDGTLYCPGADSDAGSFVLYSDKKSGVVAKNVTDFGEMSGGGYYINKDNELYVWNSSVKPLYGYNEIKTHTKILSGVRKIVFDLYYAVYIDVEDNLFLIGEFNAQEHSVESPKLLATGVSVFDTYEGTILWTNKKGEIELYGNSDKSFLDLKIMNEEFDGKSIVDISLERYQVFILQKDELWCYGDYDGLINSNKQGLQKNIMLKKGICDLETSINTLVAIDVYGNAYLWGRCLSNDRSYTSEPLYKYYNGLKVAEEVISVSVSDGSFGYVDSQGRSKIYYSGVFSRFFGNSTKDENVGIMREPAEWIR